MEVRKSWLELVTPMPVSRQIRMTLDRNLVMFFCLNDGAVSWKSSKQDTVADSTTEAEYIAASSATKEVVWIKRFISELDRVHSIVDPIGLYYDNNGAIAQAKEPRSH